MIFQGFLGVDVEEPMKYSRWAYPSDFMQFDAYNTLSTFDKEMVINHLGPFLLTVLLGM